ncbi:hypothetical protein BT69DRAFT_1283202, partial [Atractiella rhizophila]
MRMDTGMTIIIMCEMLRGKREGRRERPGEQKRGLGEASERKGGDKGKKGRRGAKKLLVLPVPIVI